MDDKSHQFASYKHVALLEDCEKATLSNLISQFLSGGDVSKSNLVSYNIPEEKESKYLHKGLIYLSLCIQLFLKHFDEPMKRFGSKLEHVLNSNLLSGKGWDEDSADYFSVLGHLDTRLDLDKEIQHEDGRYYPALAMMASKLAYENKAVIQKVVSNHWNMEFVEFYDFYNEFHKESTTQAFIFREVKDMIVVVFRGTSTFNADDWSTDFDYSWCKFKGMGKTHLGFMRALGLKKCVKEGDNDDDLGDYYGYWPKHIKQGKKHPLAYYTIREKLREMMRENENAKFIVTGHSLGGALAILFPAILAFHGEKELLDRLEGIYTYGQPRVGDEKFGRFMKKSLREHKIKYYRIVYDYDIVPRVPWDNRMMMFKHFGTCFQFNSLYQGKIVEEEKQIEREKHLIEEIFFVLIGIVMFIMKGIMARLTAVWQIIRGFIISITAGPNYREGWFLIGFRVLGILFPGAVDHNPQDYVNATRLASPDLFLNYHALTHEY